MPTGAGRIDCSQDSPQGATRGSESVNIHVAVGTTRVACQQDSPQGATHGSESVNIHVAVRIATGEILSENRYIDSVDFECEERRS